MLYFLYVIIASVVNCVLLCMYCVCSLKNRYAHIEQISFHTVFIYLSVWTTVPILAGQKFQLRGFSHWCPNKKNNTIFQMLVFLISTLKWYVMAGDSKSWWELIREASHLRDPTQSWCPLPQALLPPSWEADCGVSLINSMKTRFTWQLSLTFLRCACSFHPSTVHLAEFLFCFIFGNEMVTDYLCLKPVTNSIIRKLPWYHSQCGYAWSKKGAHLDKGRET